MVSKRDIERVVLGESVMRMAAKIRESATLDEEDLPLCMPDFVKDALKHRIPEDSFTTAVTHKAE